jgi:hypothetical protein
VKRDDVRRLFIFFFRFSSSSACPSQSHRRRLRGEAVRHRSRRHHRTLEAPPELKVRQSLQMQQLPQELPAPRMPPERKARQSPQMQQPPLELPARQSPRR